jgi:hypothetical protein
MGASTSDNPMGLAWSVTRTASPFKFCCVASECSLIICHTFRVCMCVCVYVCVCRCVRVIEVLKLFEGFNKMIWNGECARNLRSAVVVLYGVFSHNSLPMTNEIMIFSQKCVADSTSGICLGCFPNTSVELPPPRAFIVCVSEREGRVASIASISQPPCCCCLPS